LAHTSVPDIQSSHQLGGGCCLSDFFQKKPALFEAYPTFFRPPAFEELHSNLVLTVIGAPTPTVDAVPWIA
jgi:hypothetical protein